MTSQISYTNDLTDPPTAADQINVTSDLTGCVR
jgi:hypothetical protein